MNRGPGPGQSLAGYSVIVGRAVADGGSLTTALRARGAEPILIPLAERVTPTDGGAALQAVIDDLGSYRWLAFTSANGVRAVSDVLSSRPLPPGLEVAAVGPATAAVAAAAGYAVSLVSTIATAADLAAAFPPPSGVAPPDLVLAPLAELASSDLETGLEAKGYRVERVDAYRMEPTTISAEQKEAAAGADAVLFTAPSLVDLYLKALSPSLIPPVVVCIGPRTETRARQRGITGIVTAIDHNEDGLIRALLSALGPLEA